MAEKNGEFQAIIKFDCRGVEPTDFDARVSVLCSFVLYVFVSSQLRVDVGHKKILQLFYVFLVVIRTRSFQLSLQGQWCAKCTESDTVFDDIDLSEKVCYSSLLLVTTALFLLTISYGAVRSELAYAVNTSCKKLNSLPLICELTVIFGGL